MTRSNWVNILSVISCTCCRCNKPVPKCKANQRDHKLLVSGIYTFFNSLSGDHWVHSKIFLWQPRRPLVTNCGYWWSLIPIGIIYFNGSVATGHHWYRLVPMTKAVGNQWEKSKRTHCFIFARSFISNYCISALLLRILFLMLLEISALWK